MKKTSSVIAYIASVVVVMVFLWSILANIIISRPMWGFDYPYFDNKNKYPTFIVWILVIVYFILCLLLYKLIDKYDLDKRNNIITLIGAGLGILVILLIPVAPYADQAAMTGIASSILDGTFNAFDKNEYLYLYPYNAGYVMFLVPFTLISKITTVSSGFYVKFANVAFITFTGYYFSKIYQILFKNKKETSTLFLILFFSSLNILTMTNLVYGDIPGLFFFSLAIYYFVKENENKTKDYILSFSFIAIGNMFRNIGLILLIAFIIHILLTKNFKYKYLGYGVLGFASTFVIISAIESLLFNQAFPFGQTGMPIYSWIQMGFTGEVGYWTGYGILDVWKSDQYTNAEKIQIYKDNIINLLQNLKFDGFIALMSRKMHYLFGEGTYQIILYGLGEEETILYNGYGAWYYSTFITELLKNGSVLKNGTVDYSYVLNMFVLLFSIISIIKNIKNKNVLITFIAGFIAFYCLWEIKTRYIFMILPILLILTTDTLSCFLKFKILKAKANV